MQIPNRYHHSKKAQKVRLKPKAVRRRRAALKALKRPCAVTVYTDSTYVQKGITEWMANWQRRNWKTAAGKPVKNADLWRDLLAATEPHTVEWRWVKGHAGDPGNEEADRLANLAMDEVQGPANAI